VASYLVAAPVMRRFLTGSTADLVVIPGADWQGVRIVARPTVPRVDHDNARSEHDHDDVHRAERVVTSSTTSTTIGVVPETHRTFTADGESNHCCGCGYVGLTTGVCFAHTWSRRHVHRRRCSTRRPTHPWRASHPRGRAREPDARGRDGGRLSFVVRLHRRAAESEYVYLCVPTPQGADALRSLVHRVGGQRDRPSPPPETIVVNKFDVPSLGRASLSRRSGAVMSRSCPTRVPWREGKHAVHDFLNPDRHRDRGEDKAAAVRVASALHRHPRRSS